MGTAGVGPLGSVVHLVGQPAVVDGHGRDVVGEVRVRAGRGMGEGVWLGPQVGTKVPGGGHSTPDGTATQGLK